MVELTPFVVLVLLAVALVIAAQRLRVPYTIALVGLGFGIGVLASVTGYSPIGGGIRSLLAPGLFFVLLLPPIIFEAALHVNVRVLRSRAGLILFLAFLGVVFLTFLTGVVVALVTSLGLAAALVLAAILSPTDPIAVVDLFRRLRVPEELSTIVESEALLNDAVGVILFTVLLAAVSTGTPHVAAAALQFGLLVVGGAAVGLLVAGVVYVLHRRLRDPAVETALSVVAAFGSFVLASAVGASGIIACTFAGLAVGTWIAPRSTDPGVRPALYDFWSVIVYLANSVVFLAMGFVLSTVAVVEALPLILLVTAVTTLGRFAFVYLHRPLTGPDRGRLPDPWYNVIALAGIRGAIPVVLALSLLSSPGSLGPGAVRTIVATVFGVAVLTIVAGNLVAERYVDRHFPAAPVPPTGPAAAAAAAGGPRRG